jgi:tetratricopeptide (TPR) repeat protein
MDDSTKNLTGSNVHDLGELLRTQLSTDDLDGLTQIITSSRRPAGAQGSDSAPEEPDYDSVLAKVLPRVADQRARFERERQELPSLFRELLEHPPERRLVLVSNSSRFRSLSLCDLLLEKSLDACHRDTLEAIELAELAVQMSRTLSGIDHGYAILNDLRARAMCFLANAYRVARRLQDAERAFAEADELLLEGTGDLMELARLRGMQGNLSGDRRRFEQCFELYDRAMAIYRRCGETHLLGRTMIKKANFLGYAFRSEEAIEMLREGLSLVDAEREPRLVLAANHNLVLNLNESGRSEEAEELLDACRPLYNQYGERIHRLRLRWLEANLAREKGDLHTAEQAYRRTREALLQEGLGWDVALVSLELAGIYAQQGRIAEIKNLAEELVPVFRASDLRREAVAALILFQKAAQMEKISIGLIRSTVRQLRSLRQDR